MRTRGISLALPAILVVALLVRIAVLVATPDFVPIFDAADFQRHAVSIASGDGYPPPQLGLAGPSAFRPPLYPLVLAAVREVGGGMTAERVLGALLGVATVLLIYLISQRLWGRRVAVVAGAIAAVFPPLAVLNASLLSEALFLPLTLASVLALIEYRDTRELRWAAVAGLLCGFAVLTRTNGLPFVLALALGAWVLRPRFSRAALAAPVVVILAMLVAVSPWVIRNTVEFNRFVGLGTGAGYALAGTYNAESRAKGDHPGEPFSPNTLRTYRDVFAQRSLDEAQFTGRLNDRAVKYIRAHPGYVLETMAWNVPRVLDLQRRDGFERTFEALEVQALGMKRIDSPAVHLGGLYAVLLLALVGVAAQVGLLPARRAPLFVWAVPALLLLPALAIYGLPRYRAPVDPFLVMLAAVGIVAVLDRAARRPPTHG
jgi:4-amino-4-deoxy-L-arabinose transferase-like glycosyltransferase